MALHGSHVLFASLQKVIPVFLLRSWHQLYSSCWPNIPNKQQILNHDVQIQHYPLRPVVPCKIPSTLQEKQLFRDLKSDFRGKNIFCDVSICLQMHSTALPAKQRLQRFCFGEHENFPLPSKLAFPFLSAQASEIPYPLPRSASRSTDLIPMWGSVLPPNLSSPSNALVLL